MSTLSVLVIAGTIVTAQGAVWTPVTPKTMLHPVPDYVHSVPAGSVTRYKNGVEVQPKRNDPYFIPDRYFIGTKY